VIRAVMELVKTKYMFKLTFKFRNHSHEENLVMYKNGREISFRLVT
jgi:hypothetical protein